MKELTIEEKAKAYDSIIEKANKMHSENCEACKACIEELIPELAESEDEKVRKEIISHLQHEYVVKRHVSDVEYDKWLAWLGKQGQVKESTISQHENRTCKENDDSLTSEDERIRKRLITDFGTIDKKELGGLEVKEVNIASMADEYYDALMKEAADWMDEGTMGHCRLAYYTGCKDVLNKIQKGE